MPDSRPDSLGPDPLAAVAALSPVDGRYRAATEPLRDLLSEAGLIRERAAHCRDVFVYFKHEEAGKGPEFARRLLAAFAAQSLPKG